MKFLLPNDFLRFSLIQPKSVFKILVMLASWLLVLLDNCACCIAEVLPVLCTLVVVCNSNLMLATCWVWSLGTCARAASCSCCNCCSWACSSWNSALREVGLWLRMSTLHIWHWGWNYKGTLWITAAGLLSVDGALVACRGEHGSDCVMGVVYTRI